VSEFDIVFNVFDESFADKLSDFSVSGSGSNREMAT